MEFIRQAACTHPVDCIHPVGCIHLEDFIHRAGIHPMATIIIRRPFTYRQALRSIRTQFTKFTPAHHIIATAVTAATAATAGPAVAMVATAAVMAVITVDFIVVTTVVALTLDMEARMVAVLASLSVPNIHHLNSDCTPSCIIGNKQELCGHQRTQGN